MPDNLALRMRPKTIDQVIGQEHLVGPGKIIRRMVEANRLSSMILYGPPGIGKTSIASAIAGTTKYAFRTFNATVDSKKRLQEIAEEAKFSGGLVLLLDEIHRLDKTKQDFLLPLLESGLVIMIGATTEILSSLSLLPFVAEFKFLSWNLCLTKTSRGSANSSK